MNIQCNFFESIDLETEDLESGCFIKISVFDVDVDVLQISFALPMASSSPFSLRIYSAIYTFPEAFKEQKALSTE